MPSIKKIVTFDKVTIKYGRNIILKDVSFSVLQGDYIGVAGTNGAGKTTLIKAMLGLLPSEGKIELFKEELKNFKHWNKIGYLPQIHSTFNPLFPAIVKEVVGLGLLSLKKVPKRLDKNDNKRIDEILKSLQISELKNNLVADLSGGQQQRVFLARALVTNPEILVLDEPSTALDPHIRQDFFNLIDKLNKSRKMTILLITHDIGHIGKYAKKFLYLDKKIIFYGPFPDFCKNTEMKDYFGDFAQHIICHQHHHHKIIT